MISFKRGMDYFTQKQSKRAIDQFRKAVQAVPSMGMAYIFEGITWLQSENFEKAAQAADKVVENSKDDRAKAGAHGLHAVIALYNGDVMSAELLFRKAAELDPTDPEFSTSVKELSSGRYAPERVAKTAARMSCLSQKREWSQKGLLARGNFPDNKTYMRAKNRSKRSAGYKSAYDMWVGWECR
jgi:tetratricopeptide (TPR) repeat protein